jgi:hypothetical protein
VKKVNEGKRGIITGSIFKGEEGVYGDAGLRGIGR